VKSRLCGVGVLTKEQAYDLGCVGPMLRASGVAQDMRQLGYAAFNEIQGRAGHAHRRRFLRPLRRPLR
jgi:NADH:ubiquinone oxidoreductase subunit D